MLREFENGMAVALDSSGKVLRQLVRFERLPSGKTKFSVPDVPLCFPTKKAAKEAARQMHWPVCMVEKGRSLIGDVYFLRYDPRYPYALACWDI